MKLEKNSGVRLSMIFVLLFAAILLGLDIGAYWLTRWYTRLRGMPWQYALMMMASLYAASIAGWICLYKMWRLLKNIGNGAVFCKENVQLLGAISRCCLWASAVCLVSGAYYLPFILLAMAAVFMALIVRVVKSVFRQAVAMKDELDLTV